MVGSRRFPTAVGPLARPEKLRAAPDGLPNGLVGERLENPGRALEVAVLELGFDQELQDAMRKLFESKGIPVPEWGRRGRRGGWGRGDGA